ncbi:MAG: septum formation initiator family protein [Nitrospiraceae bacterium]|nr:MAG: septum formation initiator family protein [Nitrospiraceae bacterium]
MRNKRKQQVTDNRKKRHLVFVTLGILVFIYLTYSLIAGDSGLLRYIELRSKKEKMLAETNIIKKQNENDSEEIKELQKEPELLEEHAREYGLTKEGEWVFKFEDKK